MREFPLPFNLKYVAIEHEYTYGVDRPWILYVFNPIEVSVRYKDYLIKPDDFYETYCFNCGFKPLNCIGGYKEYQNTDCRLTLCLPEEEVLVNISLPEHCFGTRYGSHHIYTHYFYDDEVYPLQISNVYESGRWCTGSLEFTNNLDISEVYNKYWNTLRNRDLCAANINFKKHIQYISEDFSYLPDLQNGYEPNDVTQSDGCGSSDEDIPYFELKDSNIVFDSPTMACIDTVEFVGSTKVGNSSYIGFNR